MFQAFESLKANLTSNEVMAYYNPSAEAVVVVDGSPVRAGAILTQKQDDALFRQVAYGNKALTPTQLTYSQAERETLAVLFGCQKYHYYLYGMHFDIVTDHKPLLGIYSPTAIHIRELRNGLSSYSLMILLCDISQDI